MSPTILAGDLGGTKTSLALCTSPEPGAPPEAQIVHQATFTSAEHASLDEIVARFLAGAPDQARRPAAACFGVAGPVHGSSAAITALGWSIDARALARQLGEAPVALINDLQATALGMLTLPADRFVTLQPPGAQAPRQGGTIAVLAPGTGLGESLLVSVEGRYHALPMEAGHADFAAATDDEYELLRHLRSKHGSHVSYERVLCGDGLADIYAFLRVRAGAAEPSWLAGETPGRRNAAISAAGLAGSDALCARALEIFVEVLGAEAGNAALRGLARGGVILGGGIPPKIVPALRSAPFLARFRDKGRFSEWMHTLEVKVALEPRAALFGAAHRAEQLAT